MSGGWAGSTRSARLPADWPTRRARVRVRAGGRCEVYDGVVRCPAAGTDCDHITPGDDHRLVNLQWICPTHHQAKTLAEAEAARAARPPTRRPAEPHPALT